MEVTDDVAWKTQGVLRMGRESASFISSFAGRHTYNTTCARQLLHSYGDLKIKVHVTTSCGA
ncbi:hypothetical protein COCSUDRAFT_60841 [Coccomyxa subellipsoidea C-169]|uniref:Uncharacterized protein n=1 Tax=Coccomyxa subellipsoidea (strain C-169) TaxID=574566 RepID=I0Z5B4_COCSC|nr:hypothetical protein COCSUDRAFT_60841 [Coccomyxa subellipsoidea C-169]EIE25833.1 hypothetical protein COCSUDRAFT_60841 [Coccomyxa subellipsoidea C-169]|eukprot:XP_005650377.1 hypothetical protein COCSUDRAFT_60841 [Coccomyxa subellipsoidea C-169]